MANYKTVTDALRDGADPAMLCMTCPWDRFCITPPTMTTDEVRAQIDKATADDEAKMAERKLAGQDGGMPMVTLVTTLAIAGKDTSCQVCPVFAMRLRSSDGGELVQQIRTQMQREA